MTSVCIMMDIWKNYNTNGFGSSFRSQAAVRRDVVVVVVSISLVVHDDDDDDDDMDVE